MARQCQWVKASSSLRSQYRTPLDTPPSVRLLWTSDLLVQRPLPDFTHNTHKRQISTATAGFEPAIPVSEPLQAHDLDHAASGIGFEKNKS